MALHRLIGVCRKFFLALNIRSKLIITISALFIVILSSVSIWTYYSIEQYQKQEFAQQLADKAITVADILFRNDKGEVNFIAQLDKETHNVLYEERIFIYDKYKHLIYSSAIDTGRVFLQNVLSLLETKGGALLENNGNQVYGKLFEKGSQKLYIVVSAYDFFGTKTQKNVRSVLGLISIIGTLLLVIFMSGIVQQLLKPLYSLNKEIDNLNENNLRHNISEKQWVSTEITKLTQSYNRMLVRIADAFDNQQQFIQHASHELRTPLAVMLLQLENGLLKAKDDSNKKTFLSLKEELEKLIDLTNSLLLLSSPLLESNMAAVRVDEILFDVGEEMRQSHSDFKININLKGIESENALIVSGNILLLRLLFRNLMGNAYKYAENKQLSVSVEKVNQHLILDFVNDGNVVVEKERDYLFTPLYRASNSHVSSGFGIGLSIAKKIADYHHATISYHISDEGLNVFEVVF